MPNRYLAELAISLRHGARRRCPRCGNGSLYDGWYDLRQRCGECSLDFERLDRDWFPLMYLSTAAITGVVVLGMFVIGTAPRSLGGRLLLVAGALVVMLATLPTRKGLGLAILYQTGRWFGEGD